MRHTRWCPVSGVSRGAGAASPEGAGCRPVARVASRGVAYAVVGGARWAVCRGGLCPASPGPGSGVRSGHPSPSDMRHDRACWGTVQAFRATNIVERGVSAVRGSQDEAGGGADIVGGWRSRCGYRRFVTISTGSSVSVAHDAPGEYRPGRAGGRGCGRCARNGCRAAYVEGCGGRSRPRDPALMLSRTPATRQGCTPGRCVVNETGPPGRRDLAPPHPREPCRRRARARWHPHGF